ncbi:hypothetical protein RA27_22350 [Ruegeria sp. ANG-R]|uniref:TrbI/VirB10 family protein n=1 Tax=Ruegeria sp. ANG-R TaxID=1577903 RepID=UPI00057E319B|nr:TrbI/VirB10 family protein [Ruegeria sp. ANG-R]KIC36087.1 hypothetical protein RA27_22350 [Ruegeria sp. ANG-R]
MSDQNKLLSDRIENSEDIKTGVNWPMIGGIAALLGFIGVGVWINSGDGDTGRRDSIIPEVTETPDPRSQGGALFGAVPTEPLPQAQPQEDPRVALLAAELAELRAALDAARTQEPAVDPGPDAPQTEAPAPALDAEALAALIAQQQQAAMQPLLDQIEKDRLANERRQRELIARLQANRPIVEPGQPTAQAPADNSEAQRLEAARKAEEERLAAPLVNSLSSSGTAASGSDGANNSTGNDFLDAAASRTVETAHAEQLKDVHRLVTQGTIIPANLDTAISSDLPGELKATISRDVWSTDATTVLIPRGSTLIGEYSSDISLGQRRVLVAWNRVITTDKRTIQIGSRGVGPLGRAGLAGNVQHHFALKFEAAAFISIFTGISNLGSRTVNNSDDSSFSDGATQFGEAASDPLTEYLSIPPTIWIDHGENINVFVSRDLYM